MNTPIAEQAGDAGRAAAFVVRCHARLDALLTGSDVRCLLLAFSGGLDSTVLLHLARGYCTHRALLLEAHHVDHALQDGSAAWAAHCAEVARQWGVTYSSARLQSSPPAGASVEDWARRQRYGSLLAHCAAHAALLTAHHQDDQAETFLLHALRASGPQGLAGIRAQGRRGNTVLWRPLLAEPRAELRNYAQVHGLSWLEDPSNDALCFARNRLRGGVMPVLEREFPGAAAAFGEVARLQAEVVEALDGIVDQVLGEHEALPLALLRAQAPALRPYVVKRWLQRREAPPPPRAQLLQMLNEMLLARIDGMPQVAWGEVAVRRYDDRYFLTAARLPMPDAEAQVWSAPWSLLSVAHGQLRAEHGRGTGASSALLSTAPLTVRYRVGGERLRLHAHGPRRELKHLFQQWRVPPWQRSRWPLLYVGEVLAVVPGQAVAPEFLATADEHSVSFAWRFL